jgi:hypothetical protein
MPADPGPRLGSADDLPDRRRIDGRQRRVGADDAARHPGEADAGHGPKLWPMLDAKRLDRDVPGVAAGHETADPEATTGSPLPQRPVLPVGAGGGDPVADPERSDPLAPGPLSDEWLRRAFGFSGPGMLSRDTPAEHGADDDAGHRLKDRPRRWPLHHRRHRQADPAAVGWYRVTDGSPVRVLRAARRPPGRERPRVAVPDARERQFQAHNDCGCTAAPVLPPRPGTARHQPAGSGGVPPNRGKGPR